MEPLAPKHQSLFVKNIIVIIKGGHADQTLNGVWQLHKKAEIGHRGYDTLKVLTHELLHIFGFFHIQNVPLAAFGVDLTLAAPLGSIGVGAAYGA